MQTQAAQTAEGCGDMRGTLPARAPLANPYVPFQGQNPDRYTTRADEGHAVSGA